jgi:hypothetical protein
VEPHRPWHFDFGDMVGGHHNDDGLMDEESVTLAASAATLCCQGCTLEPHKIGMPIWNPGPPFAIGDVIMSNIGNHGLQRAFVRMSDDPRYELFLESGITVEMSRGKSFLIPKFDTSPGNMNNLAPDQDDPWEAVRLEVESRKGMINQKTVSYGVHGDAQRKSLLLVEDAKAFAKAVKADDAEVPEYLWNDRVKMGWVPKEARDMALTGFRRLGYHLFQTGLVRDCAAYLSCTYSEGWALGARTSKEGMLNELAQDQDAITSMLWHSSHTTWFEFNAGSRLVHFRFPKRYQKKARDGVKSFFERPGPTTKRAQPLIDDPILREWTRDKIGKVIKLRYLVTSGVVVKSYIKYFAVPKVDNDVRMVYDVTANKLNESVWVPTFWLPTIDMLVRGVDRGS